MRLLLVEDEPEMVTALQSAFRRQDMVVDQAATLNEAEAAAAADCYDAILLDRQLSDGDGLSLIPPLRARGNNVPAIVLTARGALVDRVRGLDTGADESQQALRIHPRRQGAGLGLNLVQEIMRPHGGQVVAADARSGGACMKMIFPAA